MLLDTWTNAHFELGVKIEVPQVGIYMGVDKLKEIPKPIEDQHEIPLPAIEVCYGSKLLFRIATGWDISGVTENIEQFNLVLVI